MLTDEEAKEYAKELLKWCNDRCKDGAGCCYSCPFYPQDECDCIGYSLDNLEEPLEETNDN